MEKEDILWHGQWKMECQDWLEWDGGRDGFFNVGQGGWFGTFDAIKFIIVLKNPNYWVF